VSIDSRLSRLSPSLVLSAWKEGKEDDPSWRRTMPQEQAHEFNRYISLMNVANREVAILIRGLKQTADQCGLRSAWFTSLVLWQEHVDEIRRAVRVRRALAHHRGRLRRGGHQEQGAVGGHR
jgi:hypothetical protein